LERGLSISEAITQVREKEEEVLPLPDLLMERFFSAVRARDETWMEAVLSEAQGTLLPGALVDGFLLPLLREMASALKLGCAHVGSALARHRLTSTKEGPRALLACAWGERDESGLLAVSMHLRQLGWHPVMLGADTSVEALVAAAKEAMPRLVVVSFVRRVRDAEMLAYLRRAVAGLSAPVVAVGSGVAGRVSLVTDAGARFVERPEQMITEVARSARRRSRRR
jgi:hypothetical protein